MKKSVTRLFLLLMMVSGWTYAQTSSSDGVRESTSPSRADEVERKAEGMSGQSSSETGASGKESKPHKRAKKSAKKSHKQGASGSSGTKGSSGTSGVPELPEAPCLCDFFADFFAFLCGLLSFPEAPVSLLL